MLSHIRASDYAETSANWKQLALDAGFDKAEELYTAPTQLARIYCFDGVR